MSERFERLHAAVVDQVRLAVPAMLPGYPERIADGIMSLLDATGLLDASRDTAVREVERLATVAESRRLAADFYRERRDDYFTDLQRAVEALATISAALDADNERELPATARRALEQVADLLDEGASDA